MAATKLGWWIHVVTDQQETSQIAFFIGPNEGNAEFWKNWNTGQDAEFDVPEKFLHEARLYIKAQSNPRGKSYFCVKYKQDNVQHYDFEDNEDHDFEQRDRDGDCG